MSDDTNAQGTPPPSTPSWTPPPPTPTPTPPTPDATGGTPAPATSGGGANITLSPALVFGLVAVVAIALSVFLKESEGGGAPGVSFWDAIGGLWSLFAIAAAIATLVPTLRSVVNLSEKTAWTVAAAGASSLVIWWVLFVLPRIDANLAFLATVGTAAGVAAAWISPGNTIKEDAGPSEAS